MTSIEQIYQKQYKHRLLNAKSLNNLTKEDWIFLLTKRYTNGDETTVDIIKHFLDNKHYPPQEILTGDMFLTFPALKTLTNHMIHVSNNVWINTFEKDYINLDDLKTYIVPRLFEINNDKFFNSFFYFLSNKCLTVTTLNSILNDQLNQYIKDNYKKIIITYDLTPVLQNSFIKLYDGKFDYQMLCNCSFNKLNKTNRTKVINNYIGEIHVENFTREYNSLFFPELMDKFSFTKEHLIDISNASSFIYILNRLDKSICFTNKDIIDFKIDFLNVNENLMKNIFDRFKENISFELLLKLVKNKKEFQFIFKNLIYIPDDTVGDLNIDPKFYIIKGINKIMDKIRVMSMCETVIFTENNKFEYALYLGYYHALGFVKPVYVIDTVTYMDPQIHGINNVSLLAPVNQVE